MRPVERVESERFAMLAMHYETRAMIFLAVAIASDSYRWVLAAFGALWWILSVVAQRVRP